MTSDDVKVWLQSVVDNIPLFLKNMRQEREGFFKHSLTGDIRKISGDCGLIQIILVVKIVSTLNSEDSLSGISHSILAENILSFQKNNGSFIDPVVKRSEYIQRVKRFIKTLNFEVLMYQNETIATTRSAYNALTCLSCLPNNRFRLLDFSCPEVTKFLNKLDWDNPWGTGSHFSHLLFFLNYEYHAGFVDKNTYEECIKAAIGVLDNYWDSEFCEWRNSKINNSNLSVNGIMKISMALSLVDQLNYFQKPEKIIDKCLNIEQGEHACDFFNVLYVLFTMNKISDYRREDCISYASSFVNVLKKYYYPDKFGFSFVQNCAEVHYYGVKYTKGLPEPDLHGTAMYLWAIALIDEICDFDLGLKALLC